MSDSEPDPGPNTVADTATSSEPDSKPDLEPDIVTSTVTYTEHAGARHRQTHNVQQHTFELQAPPQKEADRRRAIVGTRRGL